LKYPDDAFFLFFPVSSDRISSEKGTLLRIDSNRQFALQAQHIA